MFLSVIFDSPLCPVLTRSKKVHDFVQLQRKFETLYKIIPSPFNLEVHHKRFDFLRSSWSDLNLAKKGSGWFSSLPFLSSPKSHSIVNSHQSLLNEFMTDFMSFIAKYLYAILNNQLFWKSGLFMDFIGLTPSHFVNHQDPVFINPASEINNIASFTGKKYSLDDFELLKVIGKGSMGKVMLAKEKCTHQLYAIKSIHKSIILANRELEHTRSERNILAEMSNLQHPFLIHMHACFQSTTELFFVLDYYPGGDLATQLANFRKFNEDKARFYAAEMFLGISELHAHGIIYRDLKPENVLLDRSGHIVLSDFGLSKQLQQQQNMHRTAKTFCGTAEYLAPEILANLPYTEAVDWWSFGTFLYEMLTGITPFWDENPMVMYQKVLSDTLKFPSDVKGDARHLLGKLLERDPLRRFGAKSTDEIKSHPFFLKVDWNLLYEKKIPPPYIPNLISSDDFSHFDAIFTCMAPELTPSETIPLVCQNKFRGFSYDDRADG